VADAGVVLAFAPTAVDGIGTVADATIAVAVPMVAVDGIGTSEDATPSLVTNATVTPTAVDGIGTVADTAVGLAFMPAAVDGIGTSEDATPTQPIQVSWNGPDLTLAGGTWSWSLVGVSYEGTQYVDGVLAFTGATTIVLDPSIYTRGGDYVLFQYGSFPGNQGALNTHVTIDDSQLPLCELTQLQNKHNQHHVILKLRSKPTNGKQFVDGDLTFSGATTLYLDPELYATPGTYELFEVGGTVTGLANVTCISEAGLFCGAPFLDGNLVQVTLT
jgi:hypothetical protein